MKLEPNDNESAFDEDDHEEHVYLEDVNVGVVKEKHSVGISVGAK